MLQINYKNEKKILRCGQMQIIHGLTFGKQGRVCREESKKLYEHEHDNANFIHLAEVRAKFDNIMAEHLYII